MAIEPTDPLERARDLVRDTEPPSEAWEELSSSVMTKVREMVRPSYPILVSVDGEDRTYVSSRVVLTALRRMLQGQPTHAPTDLTVDVDDERLLGVHIGLAGSYGVDLVALADRVRGQVAAVLVELLDLPEDGAAGLVDITIEDVVEGDPNLV